MQGWAQTGGPQVRAGAQAALDSGDDKVIADFVAYGKEIAEKQDQKDAEDSKAEQDRITGRVRDMVAHGGSQVQVEGEAILLSGDYARIREFYLTGYAEAHQRDHDLQALIVKALEDRNKAVTEINDLARRSEQAANARAEILRANIQAIKSLDDSTMAMQMNAKAAHRADQILREDKPGRAHGQRGRDQDLVALVAETTRYTEQGARAAQTAQGTTAQVQNAAVRLIDTGMTNGLDWAKVTIAVGAATGAAAKAAETAQHATEATLADSRALDANANAQEHANNARKYREEAERQAETAADLAAAAKKQQEIAIGARDRAEQQKRIAETAAANARTHATNARNARLTAQSAATNAIARRDSAVRAHGDAVRAKTRELDAANAVQTTAAQLRTATTVCFGKMAFADQVETSLKAARDEAVKQGKNADEATKDIAEAAGRARTDANAAAAWAERARTAAAYAQSEASKAAAEAKRAREAAARAEQEAVTARRAADEAHRLAVEAANVAVAARASADRTRFEAEAAVSESNQAVFQSVIADRAASAASASAAMIIDPAKAAEVIARPYAGIDADARKALAVAAEALMVGEEQARSARDKATEAGNAATKARQAADAAIADVKPAYEAAARAADSANQAAQYAVGANEAANAAATHARGAHNAASNATRSAASARADASQARNAASAASSAAFTANQAAGGAEAIHAWAKRTTDAIHKFTDEVSAGLDQFQDLRRRQAEAQRMMREEAQRKQAELNREFFEGAAAVYACSQRLTSVDCLRFLGDMHKKAYEEGLPLIKQYVENMINCTAGDEAACASWHEANMKIADFGKDVVKGFIEGFDGFWTGMKTLGACAVEGISAPATPSCDQVVAGMKDLALHPYKLVHLDVWHDNPGKALGLSLFDLTAAAVGAALTYPLGGSGGALTKALTTVASTIAKVSTKLTGGVGRIGRFTVRLADSIPGKLPGNTGEVLGLTVKVENGLAKLDGAIAVADGQFYRLEAITLKIDGDLAKLEGAIARVDGGVLKLENGGARLDNAKFKFEPVDRVDPPTAPDRTPGRNLDDGSWVAREFGQEIKLDPAANVKANDLIKKAADAEKNDISPKVEQVMKEVPSAKPEGWDHRLKGEDSLKRKIATELAKGQPLGR
ncbi:hypothetical protein [Amycolatopsis sp. NPDC051071]|uniref:hypothetical protein n=1 Tax=Amycolatopsis sp. NPDC051071 TaxID=3154637 RepID=UPI00341954BA